MNHLQREVTFFVFFGMMGVIMWAFFYWFQFRIVRMLIQFWQAAKMDAEDAKKMAMEWRDMWMKNKRL